MTGIRKAVAVRFGGGDRTYDYWSDFPVEVGQVVVVPTKRGETRVTVVEIKDGSDQAQAALLRIHTPDGEPL